MSDMMSNNHHSLTIIACCVILFVLFPLRGLAQQQIYHEQAMFWNVENVFWPEDDPARDDDEFTPQGVRHWTQGRLRHKLLQLTRVILAAGKGRAPMLVGLAEVEGDSVMQYWTQHTPLWDQHYEYIVGEGPDRRGIQTALLYQPSDFRVLQSGSYEVFLPSGTHPTRSILHAAGRVVSGDTLDVLVCHLPSRLGGARQSQPARDAAHSRVMQLADSLISIRWQPHIIIMGDMNDYPSGRKAWWGSGYQNLMLPLQKSLRRHPSQIGSHKYQGEWGFLDQFIVNRSWSDNSGSGNVEQTGCYFGNPRAFAPDFILTDDETHLGHRPHRSYYGYQYEGGYSDHLPILLDLTISFSPD